MPRRADSTTSGDTRFDRVYKTLKSKTEISGIDIFKQDKLVLGDLSAKIDWGYSREFMDIAWKILQLDEPDDFVIALGCAGWGPGQLEWEMMQNAWLTVAYDHEIIFKLPVVSDLVAIK